MQDAEPLETSQAENAASTGTAEAVKLALAGLERAGTGKRIILIYDLSQGMLDPSGGTSDVTHQTIEDAGGDDDLQGH